MEIVCPARHPGAETLIDAIPVLADQGVTALELIVASDGYFDHHNGFELEKLLSRLSATGVRIHSIHSPFGPAYDISSPDDEIHERGVDGLIDSIELANMLEASKVIVHASDSFSNSRCRRIERARGVLRELGVVAKESGLILAVENLPPQYLGHTPEEMNELLDGTDPESVSVCFDSGHANLSGRFTDFAEAMLPRAVTMHIHDNDGTADQHRFPGQGCIDWRHFACAYRALGSRATIMLECQPPENMLWSEAFQHLRSALGE